MSNPVTTGETSYRFGMAALLLAPMAIIPAAVLLLVFGDRPDPADSAPVAVLVSAPAESATPCVMFCDEPSWTLEIPTPSTTPACVMFCDEPPVTLDMRSWSATGGGR